MSHRFVTGQQGNLTLVDWQARREQRKSAAPAEPAALLQGHFGNDMQQRRHDADDAKVAMVLFKNTPWDEVEGSYGTRMTRTVCPAKLNLTYDDFCASVSRLFDKMGVATQDREVDLIRPQEVVVHVTKRVFLDKMEDMLGTYKAAAEQNARLRK